MIFRANINQTLKRLLDQEDTNGDKKITIDDKGPKSFTIILEDQTSYGITGTYHLSNFLQELALEKAAGKTEAIIPIAKIVEQPADRISRMIRDYFWDDLTRTLEAKGLEKSLGDEKSQDATQRIYVPVTDPTAISYYEVLREKYPQLEVITLPENITPEYVKSINKEPGILALKLEQGKGVPFVVPGGRFNEMYGWDSYFEGVGLLLDNRVDLAKAMVDNFCYQITHYGKILNANRSYYLTRTQPPFLSSFILETFEKDPSIGKEWLAQVLQVAIQEYEQVWMQVPRVTKNGLNRYYAQGIGIPPETEEGHFDEHLHAFAKAYSLPLSCFISKYQSGEIQVPELDEYFTHDRSLRESGHDTSWRLDNICAHLNVVDLNSLLYKYEVDFAHIIKTYFDDSFKTFTSGYWTERALVREERINSLMWNEASGQYFDIHFETGEQTKFESASNYFPLWAGVPSRAQAKQMVQSLMESLKEKGGVAGTSQKMAAQVPDNAMQRQWDYPNGWAPHQMMIWRGLASYGFKNEMNELVYRWLWMITQNAVDYNGVIPEKYDVVAATHKVFAEYGNVGTEFDYITTSGFGWMNASYQYGLSLLSDDLRAALNNLESPESLFKE